MKVKYLIDKRESEFRKRKVLEKVTGTLGTKVAIEGEEIEVDHNNERKVVEILTHSGLKYQKVA